MYKCFEFFVYILNSRNYTFDDDNLKASLICLVDEIYHIAKIQTIQKACKIPDDGRYFNDCEDTGNTASATIPIAINKMQSLNIPLGRRALLMGFGVGLSWGGCIADLTLMDPEEEI